MTCDQAEQDLLDVYETGEMNLAHPSPTELATIKATAENTFRQEI